MAPQAEDGIFLVGALLGLVGLFYVVTGQPIGRIPLAIISLALVGTSWYLRKAIQHLRNFVAESDE